MSKCGQAAQRPLDPSRECGVAVDALLSAENAPNLKHQARHEAELVCKYLFMGIVLLLLEYIDLIGS